MDYHAQAKRICARWGQPHRECGRACIAPTGKVVAGQPGTWTVVYTVGPSGLAPRGAVRLRKHVISDWGDLQTVHPQQPGYLEVICSRADVKLEVTTWSTETIDFRAVCPCPGAAGKHYRSWVQVAPVTGRLQEGDTITLVLGQTAHGGAGVEAQSYAESHFNFLVEADCAASGEFLKVDDLFFEIVGAAPARFVVLAPSIVKRGEHFAFTVKAEDRYGNVAADYSGSIHLRAPGLDLPAEARMKPGDGGLCTVKCGASACGVARIEVHDERAGLAGISNPILIEEQPVRRLFWGEIHAHSYLSFDGRDTPANVLRYARDVARLDFASISEHEQELADEHWREYLEANAQINEEGRFVTFFGYEWKGGPGDQNIYFLNDAGPLAARRPLPGASSRSKHEINEQLKALKAEGLDCMIVPHAHRAPSAEGNLLAEWGFHDPDLETVAEICSNQGIFEDWYNRGLAHGYKLAPIGGTDSHHGDMGYSHTGAWFNCAGGLVAVYAEALTKKNVWAAIKERRAYGTAGTQRIILDFKANGHPMGTEFACQEPLCFSAKVFGAAPILKVEIFKNGQLAYRHTPPAPTPAAGSPDGILLRLAWSSDRTYANIRGTRTEPGRLGIDQGAIRLVRTVHFDNHREKAEQIGERQIAWQSVARSGDVDGVLVNVSGGRNAILTFEAPGANAGLAIPMNDILTSHALKWTLQLNDFNNARRLARFLVELDLVANPDAWDVAFDWRDPQSGGTLDYYYLKATQLDGGLAWSSPIWVTRNRATAIKNKKM